jgi:hypothetical protein
MDEKVLIRKINNLVSNEIIYNDQLKLNKELASTVGMYTIDDIESLIRYTNENTISILNDVKVTTEFNLLLENLSNKQSIDSNVANMSRLINKLYQPKNINFSYRQHCNEIFALLLNTITNNIIPDNYVYDLLYEKLLINQLNSKDTINDLIDNDLNRYIQQEKILLVKESIRDLLMMVNICSIDDMKVDISNIRQKLNIVDDFDLKNLSNIDDEDDIDEQKRELENCLMIDKQNISMFKGNPSSDKIKSLTPEDFENWNKESLDKLQSLIDIVKDTDYIQCLKKIYEIASDYVLGIFMSDDNENKGKTMKNKTKIILNDSDFAENDKESMEDDLENIEETNEVEPDSEFYADDLEQENLSLKAKVKLLNRQLKKAKSVKLNSIMIDDYADDNLNDITEITADMPSKMKEKDLNGDIGQVAIELSKLRKIVMSLAAKTEKAINLSQRESALNRSYIQLSETAEDLEGMVDELESYQENLEDFAENQESEEIESEVETQEVNNSRRSRFDRDMSHKATKTNLSAVKSSIKGRSALDIMMSRR